MTRSGGAVNDKVRVVLFTGGRGSSVLSEELVKDDRIELTLAINGYDDGLSTGEIRRFLGDSLGPSDFRKNASWLAVKLRTSDERLVDLLDFRLPQGYSGSLARATVRLIGHPGTQADDWQRRLAALADGLDASTRERLAVRLGRFDAELERTGYPFSFADCSVGNLVFAGSFLHLGRRFNNAVADYCGLLGLPAGTIENVTDGRNAWLVALDGDGRLLGTEAEIVTASQPQELKDVYLLDHLVTSEELARLAAGGQPELQRFLDRHQVRPEPNPRLLEHLARADLIVYAPGTQHSSLFPSYLTRGIGEAIARNLTAIKILITNLRADAEIAGSSSVDLINKALYYLREKDRVAVPTPCLITHFLLNDPTGSEARPYVPLGHLDRLEDPRPVRIGHYEDRITGRHDPAKVLTPFVKAFLRRGEPIRLAVILLHADSLDKISETIIEMVRAGIEKLPVRVTVYYEAPNGLDPGFVSALPFDVRTFAGTGEDRAAALCRVASDPNVDFVTLFESSGMYRGDDLVNLAMHLNSSRRLDAVWGSRRLSVNDIREAYRLVYQSPSVKAAISYVGSHVLSLCYLLLYGRYISDTLSGIRTIRSSFLRQEPLDPYRAEFNQVVLSALLRRRAELFETPVYYFPISPEKVRRTTVGDGLRALYTILRGRWRRSPVLQEVDDRKTERALIDLRKPDP